MEKRRLTKKDLDKVRQREGFPLARDEEIIALSEAPWFTACPNPFLEEFIRLNGTPYDEAADRYRREPFSADVSEGKSDPIYTAHSYHTKVPHRAIMQYILHYTEPGDIVLDGFCGSGMTGVAAQMCEDPDLLFRAKAAKSLPNARYGARKAILNDLSPAAAFIAANYNTAIDGDAFLQTMEKLLDEVQAELGWMYSTRHTQKENPFSAEEKGVILYTLWSDVFICPNCGSEVIYWDAAVDEDRHMRQTIHCSRCGAELKKSRCQRAVETRFHSRTEQVQTVAKQAPVLICYRHGGVRYEKRRMRRTWL